MTTKLKGQRPGSTGGAADELVELPNDNTGNLKVNIAKAKEKLRAAVHAIQAGNRLKLLNENFNGYLERHRDDSATLRVQKGNEAAQKEKKSQRKFVEDSATGRPFKDFYKLGEVLGEGGYACVYRATHKRTKEVYAVKDIDTMDKGFCRSSNL